MSVLLAALKLVGPPGSLSFLAVVLAVGVGGSYATGRSRRFRWGWCIGVLGTYVLLSTPVVAHQIVRLLPGGPSVMVAPVRGDLDLIIIFDGDNRRGRANEAVRLFQASGARILVLGEPWIALRLIETGVPAVRIERSGEAATTLEQLRQVEHRMQTETPRAAIVASRLQMPRIGALVASRHLHVALAPSPVDTEPPRSGAWTLVPHYSALRVSRDALYECAAIAYYRWRGWT